MASREERKEEFTEWLEEQAEAIGEGIVDFFINDLYDKYDPYGSVMGAFFDVAEILDADGRVVPESWDYRPGMGTRTVQQIADEGSELAMMYLSGEISARELRELGDFLNEADDMVRQLGLDY